MNPANRVPEAKQPTRPALDRSRPAHALDKNRALIYHRIKCPVDCAFQNFGDPNFEWSVINVGFWSEKMAGDTVIVTISEPNAAFTHRETQALAGVPARTDRLRLSGGSLRIVWFCGSGIPEDRRCLRPPLTVQPRALSYRTRIARTTIGARTLPGAVAPATSLT